jgi:putative DNA primase/helicase
MSHLLPSPQQPRKVARKLLHAKYSHGLHVTLRYWRGVWLQWEGSRWVEVESTAVRGAAYDFTEDAVFKVQTKNEELERDWNPDSNKIRNVLDAMQSLVLLPETVEAPSWLGEAPTHGVTVSCANGLLGVGSRELLPHTPQYFNQVAVPFDYDPDAPSPDRWLTFLDALWPDNPACIDALQEWFGYVISGSTDLHKIMLIVGPPRGGKGVMTRVLSHLVGTGNVASPTLSGLTGEFGLSPLLGTPLATITDARLSGRGNTAVVERLLSISGEDSITVNRKYREQWTGKLPARFMIVSNELPQFGDTSGALASRFLPLRLSNSWAGQEDKTIESGVLQNLPGVLNWALEGLARLTEQGRFTDPEPADDSGTTTTYAELVELASPVAAFLYERCKVDANATAPTGAVWRAWQAWADANGHRAGTTATLGRDLASQVHGLTKVRTTDGGARCQAYRGLALLPDSEPVI